MSFATNDATAFSTSSSLFNHSRTSNSDEAEVGSSWALPKEDISMETTVSYNGSLGGKDGVKALGRTPTEMTRNGFSSNGSALNGMKGAANDLPQAGRRDSAWMSDTGETSSSDMMAKNGTGKRFLLSNGSNNNYDIVSPPVLFKIRDVPQHLRFNPFILTGYRSADLSFWDSLCSLAYLHNETINILTHGVALIMFLVVMPSYIPWGEINLPILAYCHILGSFSSWLGSSIYHLFMNHKNGEQAYVSLLMWDVTGIWVTQTFGACTTVYTSVILYPYWFQVFFIAVYVLFSVRSLRDSILAKSVWSRILGFGYLVVLRVIAVGLRMMAIESGKAAALIHILMQEIWPLLGSLISGTRVPERWWPGRFDLILNSHNLMHIFVVLGAIHMHWATTRDLLFLANLSNNRSLEADPL